MTQFDFGDIDPGQTSGAELAELLGDWRDALNSCHKGNSRPAYAVAGMIWIKNGSPEWEVMLFSGSADRRLFWINPTTGVIRFADSGARTVLLENLEASNLTADGMLGFDSSQGLKIYRTQHVGDAAGDGAYTVLDTSNIRAGSGIAITNLAPGVSGTESVEFSLEPGGLIRGDNVNNGAVNLRVDDADFIVSDGTDPTTNIIWRDHSANKLNLGTPNAVPTLRANLDMNGQKVVGDLVSNGGDKIKSGAAYIENGHIVWEEGVNRITHNDGGGNVQIRFGNEYDGGEKFTHNMTAFYIGGDLDDPNGSLHMKVAANGGAGTGQNVVWGDLFQVLKDDVRFAGVSLKAPLGNSQTWAHVGGSRAAGTFYQNTSGRAIAVAIVGWLSGSEGHVFQVGPNTTNLTNVASAGRSGSWRQNVFTVVPNGWWYRLQSGSFYTWSELS